MKTVSTLLNFATGLTQNLTATNQSNLLTWMNDQNRYLIQKYFDNEFTVTTSTVGSGSATLTGSLSIGAVNATLTVAWAYPTNSQLVQFSNGQERNVVFTYNSTALTWSDALTSTATTAISYSGYQYYNIPANISKITDNTITVGQLKFTVMVVESRQDWDRINFLPYNSDIPQYAFIYGGTNGNVLGIFPIPSTTGNILTFNAKRRVPDFSTAFLFSDAVGTAYVAGSTTYDYQKGTVTGTAGSTTVTGVATAFSTGFPSGDVTKYNLWFSAAAPKGDGIWYPIYTVDSATQITLSLPLGTSITAGATYNIGQMPYLQEDFHDMIVDGALMRYFADIVKDPETRKSHKESYDLRLELLADYAGTKQINVDLGPGPSPTNPNLYLYANTGS